MKYDHIDLFSGIGGFSLGLKEAGFPIKDTYFSEVDKYAISIYKRNFPNAKHIGGVESVSGTRFKGRKTILTFGFPCQDLSIAGQRKGFDGSRSSLFFEAVRVISGSRPDIFIFENVKGFYSSNDGKDFQIALQTIADLGIYECEWQLLNTAWFLPQNRERIYFVGHLRGTSGRKVFPVREEHPNVKGKRKGFKDGIRVQAIDSNYYKGPDGKRTMIQVGDYRADEGFRIRKDNNSPSLCTRAREDGNGQPVITAQKSRENGQEVDQNIRRLTPIECERLQGFPDNWTKYRHEGQVISDSQRYKTTGNAVSVPVVKCIGERLNA